MKIHYSLPTNDGFFNRYATLIPTLSKLGIVSQLISALTEIGIIYSIIHSRVYELAPGHAQTIAVIGAIIGTAFLEIGLRKFTPYSVRAFLYSRFKGLDLAMTVFIISVCIGLLFTSGALSFKGSKEMVKIASPLPELKDPDKIEKKSKENREALKLIFSSDSATIAGSFYQQIESKDKQYAALISEQRTRLNRYTRMEKKEGTSYQTRKERIKEKIASLEVERNRLIAQLKASQATELKTLSDNRRSDLKALESRYQSEKDRLESANIAAEVKLEKTTGYYGLGLAWFTIICLSVFVFSVIIEQIHYKGSGVKQIVMPTQYYFSQPVLSDLSSMIYEKLNYTLRNRIQRWASKTPPPPLPAGPSNLYDLSALSQQWIVVDPDRAGLLSKSGIKSDNQYLSELEQIIIQYLKAYLDLKKCNLIEESDQMELKADQVIKAYLGNQATPENVTSLKKELIGFIIGKNPNPFEKHHHRPIGFKIENNYPCKESLRKSYNAHNPHGKERTCANCQSTYIYKHHKQKYCTEKCRIEAWEKRTGKSLMMRRRK